MTRQAANYEILNKLYAIVEKHPDWRFHQILFNLDISLTGVDQYYEESKDTLERVKPAAAIIQKVYEIKD
jgi:hypothetical protein